MPENECRNDPCTCTSDERWSCLTGQYNRRDRPKEEEDCKKITTQFKEAILAGDMTKAQELLPQVRFKY